jgi:lysophospholipase L1-like esterase
MTMTGSTTAGSWTTAHLAALAAVDPAFSWAPQPLDHSGRTVRQAVRLRRGGTAIRVVLSNEYGDGPLELDEVTVRDGGGRTVLPVPRGGRLRWEIPAGETVTSDPVPLATIAGEELLISCFAAGPVPVASYLHSAQRTGETAPGNQASERELRGASQFLSLYWIARVLVDAPADGPVIVAFGDSITRGDKTTPDRDRRYPDQLQRRLLSAGSGEAGLRGAVVLNAGLGANRVLKAGLGPSMRDRFTRDVLSVPEATHVIIMGGANDIGLPGLLGGAPPTGRELADGLLELAARAKGHGIQPILGTTTPFRGADQSLRETVNGAIRSQRDWPVAEFAAAVADPANGARLLPALDSGDGLHPGDAGALAMAMAVDLTLFG